MELVLRIYAISPGELDDRVDEWRAHVLCCRSGGNSGSKCSVPG